MTSPKVSFVVPCYRLAHFLRDCVTSILSQTYEDLEVLILDDCSPDDTAKVALSFTDARVRYIKNQVNLGHLKNYNHGIELAKGKYIWLVSADDRLRRNYILQRYVQVMEDHPEVGYACCSAALLLGDRETGIDRSFGDRDVIFEGKQLSRRLLKEGNCVVAGSGMVRRECYEKLGAFPLDMPYAGDWYLWCLFALHYDVAYFGEPMVNYRQHESSMTNQLTGERLAVRFKDGLAVLWRIRRHVEELGDDGMVSLCRDRIAYQYGQNLVGREVEGTTFRMSKDEFEQSLDNNSHNLQEMDYIKARTWEIAGDSHTRRRDFDAACACYDLARKYEPWNPKLWTKQSLVALGLGSAALTCRDAVFAVRRRVSGLAPNL